MTDLKPDEILAAIDKALKTVARRFGANGSGAPLAPKGSYVGAPIDGKILGKEISEFSQ